MEDARDPRPAPTEPVERPAAAARTRLTPGHSIGKRYEVRRLLAAGGMGAVYVAWDGLRGEEIALKILLPEWFGNEHLRKRFLEEARNTSALRHENIVSVYDVQIDEDEVFLTMELLEGVTLHEHIRSRRENARYFSVEEMLVIAKTMLTTLDYAHKKDVVHRDIKPNNVFLCSNGTLKIMDFGIAHFGAAPQLTQPGAVMGTPRFMSPEQRKGERVDHRTDQFACGVVLCDILGIDPPELREKAARTVRADIPEEVIRVIDKALAPARDARHLDMLAFERALAEAVGHGAAEPARTRRPELWIAGALAACAVGGLALAYLEHWGPFAAPAPETHPPGPEHKGEVDLPSKPLDAAAPDALTNGTTALIRAVRAEDLAEVRRCLDAGAHLEVAGTAEGLQALHVAAQRDATDIARELMDRGAKVITLDALGRTPLHHAATNPSGGVLALLLDEPALLNFKERIDARDVQRSTPLHLAARAHATANARRLLAAGANRLARNGAENTPLHELALAEPGPEQVELAELLLQPRPEELLSLPNGASKTAQALAEEHGAQALAAYLAGLVPHGSTPVLPVVPKPEEPPADLEHLDTKGRTALMQAIESGNLADVRALLGRGARVDTRSGEALGGCFALHLAALGDCDECVRELLDKDARVDATDTGLRTPLHYCALSSAESRGTKALELLLEHVRPRGAGNLDARAKGGDTPLMEAARSGNEPVWKRLLEAGADRSLANDNGNTALHLLALRKNATPELQRQMASECLTGLPAADKKRLLDTVNGNLETPEALAQSRAADLYAFFRSVREGG